MNSKNLIFSLITCTGLLSGFNAEAQFSGLLQKAKDKAAQKASDAMDKKTSSSPSGTTTDNSRHGSKAVINTGFDFVAGDSVLFTEDFSGVPVGATAKTFKTNGSASVVTIGNESGKWLALGDNATYKLTRQIFYPKHFTVEFDIFAAADQIRDIYPVVYGFTSDNSVRDFNSGDGAYVSLRYYNTDDINIYSSFNQKDLGTRFDLSAYANRKMHVSVEVDGERMVVYLDQTKLADTQMFLPTSAKNFYISGPMQYHNGSKVLVSNFKIMTFKKR